MPAGERALQTGAQSDVFMQWPKRQESSHSKFCLAFALTEIRALLRMRPKSALNTCTLKKDQPKFQAQTVYQLKSSLVILKNLWRLLKRCFTLNSVSVKTKKQHQIFVPVGKLTSKNLGPTPQELYSLMHLTSCDHAIQRWKPHWMMCPVCCAPFGLAIDTEFGSGIVGCHIHKSRKEITH